MDLSNVTNVLSITIICMLVGMVANNLLKPSKLNECWVPVIVGLFGGLLGVLGMRYMPNYPADNVIDAIATGIVSGLASTGVHQIYKQQVKKKTGGNT